MTNRTFAIAFALVALVALVCTFAIPVHASADAPSITVSIDPATVDAQLGTCAAGRQIVVVTDRSHYSGHGVVEITVSTRPGGFPNVHLECDGELEPVPSRGVDVQMSL